MPRPQPPAPRPTGRARSEGGFSLVEQLIAISLLVGVLLTLLGALGSGAAGVVGGRQRTLATSLARQAVERLQGAGYPTVLMDLASPGLDADTRIAVDGLTGTRSFEGEPLVGGGSTPYRTTVEASGTTFVLSTYITSVTPTDALPHRRITVFAEWSPSGTGDVRSQRFSSLVYPLDYASYPAGSATAEVTRATASVRGTLGSDTFEDVVVTLPTARSATSSSTLRTAQGTASSATAALDLHAGPLATTQCTPAGTDATRCPLQDLDRFADNDLSTAAPIWLGGSPSLYSGATVTTPGGATFTTPAGSADSHGSVAACSGCGFGDADAVPWADATSTSSDAASASFILGGTGLLTGRLWDVAGGWQATTSVDHDTTTSGGTVTATAALGAPAVKVLTIGGAIGFDGAVKIDPFTATATAGAGNTSSSPGVAVAPVSVQLWDGFAYRTETVTLGTTTDVSATGTVVVGADLVTMTSRVQTQPSTTTSTGTSPATSGVAQLPSLLVVTVDATVTGAHPGSFTTTFDYGLVTARGNWQVSA